MSSHTTKQKGEQEDHKLEIIGLPDEDVPERSGSDNQLQYGIEDVPPWYLCIILGFQHYLTMVGATISIPLLLAPAFCIQDPVSGIANELAKAELMGTMFFVSGLITLLQTTFGCRLPIVQGGTFAFIPPTFAILNGLGSCPTVLSADTNLTSYLAMYPNATGYVVAGSPQHNDLWMGRIRMVQGAIVVSALFEILIGFTGLIGLMLRFIGPVTIVPTISLIGLSLFQTAANIASSQWGIAFLTIGLLALFAEYMKKVKIPCCTFSYITRRCMKGKEYPFFRLFPVILAMFVSYSVCLILTYTDAIPNDPSNVNYRARTDSRISVFVKAEWFRFPYPCQWGLPTVTVAGVFGMLAGVIASIVESVGDYYAAARLSGAAPPTSPAINRGIFMEGVGCVIAGLWGTGNGTTSYSENIGALGITQVGSRRVVQSGAVILVILGLITKFTAVFVTIPEPIIGGVYIVMFGMVTAVGLSNLQFVDLNSSRNLFILGISLLLGLAIPDWIQRNGQAVNTGSEIMDEIIVVLLSTSMFIGGAVGFLLDNTVPGTLEERGMLTWVKQSAGDLENDAAVRSYGCPFGNNYISRSTWTSYIPICPSFAGFRSSVKNITISGYVEERSQRTEL